jgi:hypothetical protein
LSGVVKARETVAIDTPAWRATWRIEVARLEDTGGLLVKDERALVRGDIFNELVDHAPLR